MQRMPTAIRSLLHAHRQPEDRDTKPEQCLGTGTHDASEERRVVCADVAIIAIIVIVIVAVIVVVIVVIVVVVGRGCRDDLQAQETLARGTAIPDVRQHAVCRHVNNMI